MDVQRIESPEQLATLLTGLSDGEIVATVAELGVDAVLDRIFEVMPRRFDAAKAAGQQATIQWTVMGADPGEGGGEGRSYLVRVADGSCTAERGAMDGTPDVGLVLSLPVFLRLVSGTLSGTAAFMGGQLQLTGNVMTAMSIQAWFGI